MRDIERLAGAIARAVCEMPIAPGESVVEIDPDDLNSGDRDATTIEYLSSTHWGEKDSRELIERAAMVAVRALLQELREPSIEMIDAALWDHQLEGDKALHRGTARATFRDMLDHILAEGAES